MSIFNPNPDKASNKIDTTLKANYAKIEPSRETEFGTIDPKNNEIIQFNLKQESKAETSNNTTNIRITQSELAIRLDEYDYFKGKFNLYFPTSDVYTFCKPELSIVFQNGGYQYTRKISDTRSIRNGAGDGAYPPKVSIQRVVDSVQQNQYGKNFTGSSNCCPGGARPDPVTGLCARGPELCMPDPLEPCPEPEFVNLKNTIQGYAFYAHRIKTVNIPNIGRRTLRCAGGHVCNNTTFMPQLILQDNTVIDASNQISMDNLPAYSGYTPQSNPIFDAALDLGAGEVGDSFTFTVPDASLLNDNCNITLECLETVAWSANRFCHNGVTMIFLVGQRSDNDQYVLLFADCVAPGSFNAKFLGSVPCNNDDVPIECCDSGHINDCFPTLSPFPPTTPTPPITLPPCEPFEAQQVIINITGVDIPLECLGDETAKNDLESMINQTHTINLVNIDTFSISIDNPFIVEPTENVGSIQTRIFFTLVNNGNDDWIPLVQLQIVLPQSPYPFIYGLSYGSDELINQTNLCNFTLSDGTRNLAEGINAPFCTGNGSDVWNIFLV